MNRSIAIVVALFAVLATGWYVAGEREAPPMSSQPPPPQAGVAGNDPTAPASASSVGR